MCTRLTKPFLLFEYFFSFSFSLSPSRSVSFGVTRSPQHSEFLTWFSNPARERASDKGFVHQKLLRLKLAAKMFAVKSADIAARVASEEEAHARANSTVQFSTDVNLGGVPDDAPMSIELRSRIITDSAVAEVAQVYGLEAGKSFAVVEITVEDTVSDLSQRIAMMQELISRAPLPPFVEVTISEAESAGKKVIRVIAAVPAELIPLPPQLFQQWEHQVCIFIYFATDVCLSLSSILCLLVPSHTHTHFLSFRCITFMYIVGSVHSIVFVLAPHAHVLLHLLTQAGHTGGSGSLSFPVSFDQFLNDETLVGADALGVRVQGTSAYLRGSLDFMQALGPVGAVSSLLAGFSYKLRTGSFASGMKEMLDAAHAALAAGAGEQENGEADGEENAIVEADEELQDFTEKVGILFQTQPQLMALLEQMLVPEIVESGPAGKATFGMVSGLFGGVIGPSSVRLVLNSGGSGAADINLIFKEFNVVRFGLALAHRFTEVAKAHGWCAVDEDSPLEVRHVCVSRLDDGKCSIVQDFGMHTFTHVPNSTPPCRTDRTGAQEHCHGRYSPERRGVRRAHRVQDGPAAAGAPSGHVDSG